MKHVFSSSGDRSSNQTSHFVKKNLILKDVDNYHIYIELKFQLDQTKNVVMIVRKELACECIVSMKTCFFCVRKDRSSDKSKKGIILKFYYVIGIVIEYI